MPVTRRTLVWACALVLMANGAWGAADPVIQPAADAPQPMSPEQSAEKMQLPAGFRIELVASEPLVAEPTCVAFDEYGRFFVCELHGYNLEGHLDVVELNKTGKLDTRVRRIRWERVENQRIAEETRKNQYGTVKLLRDLDGDGRMDQAHVWADRIPTCYGIVPARDGVIVVCAPDILFLADRDGDGKAEIRETLFTGFRVELLERSINNPRWGLDNWIYVGAGGGGGTIRGPRLAAPVEVGDTDFRMKADGTAIEPVHGKVRTFGMTMNHIGDRFPSTSRPLNYALPLPYHYMKRNPHVVTPEASRIAASFSRAYGISRPHPWRVKRGQDPDWVNFYGKGETASGYFTGGSGGEIYMADRFPPDYRGNFFSCESSQNLINRAILERDGAGYRAHRAAGETESEFLASTDQWFRPVNLRTGPDGALYIVDMYREIIEDYSAIPRFLQQQYGVIKGSDYGRIWRLVAGTDTRSENVPLNEMTTGQLVQATGHANAWWRQTAQRVLIERGDRTAVPALLAQVRRGRTTPARLHALYTLDGLGELAPAEVTAALSDSSYAVRMHALRLADRWLGTREDVLAKVLAMSGDTDPKVRLQLAMSLGETSDPRAFKALLELAHTRGDERWMRAAILSSVRQSAGRLLVAILNEESLTAGDRSVLSWLATTMMAREEAGHVSLVLDSFSHHDDDVQVACLQGLLIGLSPGEASGPLLTANWDSLTRLLKSQSGEVRTLALQLAARLGLQTVEMERAFQKAAQQALEEDAPNDRRRKAIQLLADAPYAILSVTALELLDVRQPVALQKAAIEALGTSAGPRVGVVLMEGWTGFTPQVRQAVLKVVFSREDRLPALLDAMEAKRIRQDDVNDLQWQQLLQSRHARIATRARSLFDQTGADAQMQDRIDRYQQALVGDRNVDNGRQVFAKNCLACHKIKEEGQQVGPPLGSVVNKPDEAILLDILYPSGHIESEYTSYVVVTQRGRIFTGILTSDSATSIVLLRDKGLTDTVLRTDIESMTASGMSLMPSDVHKVVSPQDVADLIAYLREVFGPVNSVEE